MKYLYMLFVVLAACSPTKIAMEKPVPREKIETITYKIDEVYEIGTIDLYELSRFRKNFKNIRVLVLNSSGGIVSYAFEIALIIRRMNITTIIPDNAECFSVCTLLFQAGTERIISPSAKLMYHGIRYPRPSMNNYMTECSEWTSLNGCEDRFEFMKIYITKNTLEYFFLLEYYGLDRKVFGLLKSQPVSQTWLETGNLTGHDDLYLNADNAIKYNAATEKQNVSIN